MLANKNKKARKHTRPLTNNKFLQKLQEEPGKKMKPVLSDILDYSIENNNISVINSYDGTVYFIPYDGLGLDALLETIPYIEVNSDDDETTDPFNFTVLCKYSHIGPTNNLNARYELRLGQTLLATEFAPLINNSRAKPQSLLRIARKCARKIIAQERAALKYNTVKTFGIDSEYSS